MYKMILMSLLISVNAFAESSCLNYAPTYGNYFDSLMTMVDPANSSAESQKLLSDVREMGVDTQQLYISPYPLKIRARGVDLLATIDSGGVVSCIVIKVPLRKKCDVVGLEYNSNERLKTDLPQASQLGDMEQELCGLTP